jgi:hypothetical protein
MNKLKALLLVSIIPVLLTGCATNIGNRNTTDIGRFMNLEKNTSTKNDVYTEFGQPHDVNYIANNESFWTYYYTKMEMSGATFVPFIGLVAGGSNTDTTVTDFYFDRDAVFTKISSQNFTKYVNQWVGITKGVHELVTDEKHERVEAEMKRLGLPFDPKIAQSVKDIGIITE